MGVRVLGLMGFYPQIRWELAGALGEEGWLVWPFMDPVHHAIHALNPIVIDDQIHGGLDAYQDLMEREKARRESKDLPRSFTQLARALTRTYAGVHHLEQVAMPHMASQSLGLPDLWIRQWRAAAEEDLKNGKSLVIPDVETEAQAEAIRAVAMSPFSRIARITSSGSGREENGLAASWPGDVSVRDEGEGLEILKDRLLEAITPRRAQEYADPDSAPREDPEPTPGSDAPESALEPDSPSDSSSAESRP